MHTCCCKDSGPSGLGIRIIHTFKLLSLSSIYSTRLQNRNTFHVPFHLALVRVRFRFHCNSHSVSLILIHIRLLFLPRTLATTYTAFCLQLLEWLDNLFCVTGSGGNTGEADSNSVFSTVTGPEKADPRPDGCHATQSLLSKSWPSSRTWLLHTQAV